MKKYIIYISILACLFIFTGLVMLGGWGLAFLVIGVLMLILGPVFINLLGN